MLVYERHAGHQPIGDHQPRPGPLKPDLVEVATRAVRQHDPITRQQNAGKHDFDFLRHALAWRIALAGLTAAAPLRFISVDSVSSERAVPTLLATGEGHEVKRLPRRWLPEATRCGRISPPSTRVDPIAERSYLTVSSQSEYTSESFR